MPFIDCPLKTSTTRNSFSGKEKDIENLNTLFEPYNIKVTNTIEASQIIRYILDLPIDVKSIAKIKRDSKAIESALCVALKTNNIGFKMDEDKLIIERKSDFNIVPFGNLFTPKFLNSTDGLTVILGQDMDGKAVYTDIAKAPHILIAGTTGSGKSETIHSIIASLLMRFSYGHNAPGIAIIDMKGSEYNKYKNSYPVKIYREEKEAFKLLDTLCDLMDMRYKMFTDADCDDIYGYRAKGNKMTSIVCVIDELADLILQNRSVETKIVRLAQKARGCGIHLILGTQRPSKDVVTGLIKANIPYKIALNTANATDSRIILGENGAEKLLGNGDMLIKKNGNTPVHVQGCFVCDEDKENIANVSYLDGTNFEIIPCESSTCPPDYSAAYYSQKYANLSPYKVTTPPKKQRVGFFQSIVNLWNTKPIMFTSYNCPPRI